MNSGWVKIGLFCLTVAFITFIVGYWLYNVIGDDMILHEATALGVVFAGTSMVALFASFKKNP